MLRPPSPSALALIVVIHCLCHFVIAMSGSFWPETPGWDFYKAPQTPPTGEALPAASDESGGSIHDGSDKEEDEEAVLKRPAGAAIMKKPSMKRPAAASPHGDSDDDEKVRRPKAKAKATPKAASNSKGDDDEKVSRAKAKAKATAKAANNSKRRPKAKTMPAVVHSKVIPHLGSQPHDSACQSSFQVVLKEPKAAKATWLPWMLQMPPQGLNLLCVAN